MDPMPPHRVTRCRDCPAQIVWTVTNNGRRMPVDLLPVLGGNVVLTTGTDTTPESRVLSRDETERRAGNGTRAFVSHFATCPNAPARRKAKR